MYPNAESICGNVRQSGFAYTNSYIRCYKIYNFNREMTDHLLVVIDSSGVDTISEVIYFTANDSPYTNAEHFYESWIKYNNAQLYQTDVYILGMLPKTTITTVNIDKFNSGFPNLKLFVSANRSKNDITLRYYHDNIIIKYPFNRTDASLLASIKNQCKLLLDLDKRHESYFTNIKIITEIRNQHPSNNINLDYAELIALKAPNSLLPQISDISEFNVDKAKLLLHMMLKPSKGKWFNPKVIHANNIRFTIRANPSKCCIVFFGVKLEFSSLNDIDMLCESSQFRYMMCFLQKSNRFELLLNKLEMQLLS